MKRNSFYNDETRERHIDFLGDYRVIRKYMTKKYKLTAGEFEFLCKLHSLKRFIKKDFDDAKITISWDYDLWSKMKVDGWTRVWRERVPSKGQNYKIYTTSRKTNTMMEECYKILCGEKDIPEEVRKNPVMREMTYNDSRYAKAMRMFNETRNKTE